MPHQSATWERRRDRHRHFRLTSERVFHDFCPKPAEKSRRDGYLFFIEDGQPAPRSPREMDRERKFSRPAHTCVLYEAIGAAISAPLGIGMSDTIATGRR